jgi:RNA polymerase sigma-70 factor (ECF subfamily)
MDHRSETLTPSAYGRLLKGMLEQAAGYALSILRNRADAEDAVQQAALRGLERISLYDSRQPFKGWWFTVLRHCCIDLLRSRRSHASLDQADCDVAHHGNTPAWQDLAEGLDRLESQQAEILRLRYFGGLTYEELGQALAIPKGTVMSRLYYAKKALYAEMKDSEA